MADLIPDCWQLSFNGDAESASGVCHFGGDGIRSGLPLNGMAVRKHLQRGNSKGIMISESIIERVETMTLLSGLKILDFSTLLPGPFATLLLSDLGAEVLCVKRPKTEESKMLTDYLDRGKKSIELDLKQENSIKLVKELIHEYDIVIEQFRPGVMDRLGIGYDSLKEINPELIYCSVTGFGQSGPYRNKPGHDINYVALSGVSGYSGKKGQGPGPNATQLADIGGGSMYAVAAILSSVIYRQNTGKGQQIDISMTDCTFSYNAISAPLHFIGKKDLLPEQLLLNGGTFYGHYETRDGRYFSVGSLEPPFRRQLCQDIGRPELFEMSMSNKESDILAFKEALKQAFLGRTFDEWLTVFEQSESCVEPVLSFEEAYHHPQLAERGMVVEVADDQGKLQKQIACPIKTSLFRPEYAHAGAKRMKAEEWMEALIRKP